MIRLVRDPAGALFIDRHLRAPGRGAHLCYDPNCIKKAIRKRAFSRALQGPVPTPELEAFIAEIKASVEARILTRLTIGRRARQLLSGTDVLKRGMSRVALLILAEDGAEASIERLRRQAEGLERPVFMFGSAATLGETQGAARRIAIGITSAELAGTLQREFERRASLSGAPLKKDQKTTRETPRGEQTHAT